jgi:hypothetical protein
MLCAACLLPIVGVLSHMLKAQGLKRGRAYIEQGLPYLPRRDDFRGPFPYSRVP